MLVIELEHRAERSFGQIRARAPRVVALTVSSVAALTAISGFDRGNKNSAGSLFFLGAALRRKAPRSLCHSWGSAGTYREVPELRTDG